MGMRGVIQWIGESVYVSYPLLFSSAFFTEWRILQADHSVYKSHNTEHNSPHFALLTDEITESVLFYETGWYSLASAPIWCCKHCPEHFGLPVTKKKVIIHVSEK